MVKEGRKCLRDLLAYTDAPGSPPLATEIRADAKAFEEEVASLDKHRGRAAASTWYDQLAVECELAGFSHRAGGPPFNAEELARRVGRLRRSVQRVSWVTHDDDARLRELQETLPLTLRLVGLAPAEP